MIPEPVTPAARDTGRRAQSLYDLEVTLVGFITNLFTDTYRLDNPTLNLAQPTGEPEVTHPIETGPDEPPVSYNVRERAQTLALKVPPRVSRGRVPRTVTGEIAVDKLPDSPAIIVQAVSSRIDYLDTHVTVRILVNAYDENPDGSGYQDVQNMVDALAYNLGSYGQQGIDKAYPIVLPIEWKLIEADTFPHYIADMTTEWQYPSPRNMPDAETFGIVPGEHLETRLEQGPQLDPRLAPI